MPSVECHCPLLTVFSLLVAPTEGLRLSSTFSSCPTARQDNPSTQDQISREQRAGAASKSLLSTNAMDTVRHQFPSPTSRGFDKSLPFGFFCGRSRTDKGTLQSTRWELRMPMWHQSTRVTCGSASRT